MKKQKRIFTLLLALAIVSSMATTTMAVAPEAPIAQTQEHQERKDVIVPYYREYNGYLQRRYWNETKGYWVTKWETIGVAT